MQVGRYAHAIQFSCFKKESIPVLFLCRAQDTRSVCLPYTRITNEAYVIIITDNDQLTLGLRSWKTQRPFK